MQPLVDYPVPQCERYWNPDQPEHGWLTIINHCREAVEADLSSCGQITLVDLTAGEAVITGTRIRLEPLQAAMIEVTIETLSPNEKKEFFL